MGTCRFDGKKITYNDTVALGPHQPIDHSYTAEISDGKIVKEVFEGWFRMSEEKAPDEIPDEYYNF